MGNNSLFGLEVVPECQEVQTPRSRDKSGMGASGVLVSLHWNEYLMAVHVNFLIFYAALWNQSMTLRNLYQIRKHNFRGGPLETK
jgi:hypothetical protein